ncbi:hypothetical protein R6Q57_017633 [Mikania cordata]
MVNRLFRQGTSSQIHFDLRMLLFLSQHQFLESHHKPENSGLQKGLGVIASSLNYIGNALEEGRTIVENRTAGVIQETRKQHIKKKSGIPETQSASSNVEMNKHLQQMHTQYQSRTQTDIEIQLKASRDIRLQLESLLAEKARLAQENSVYARENRFLREIVEYHQLTMQDVIYIDEHTEEVSQVYPVNKFTTHSLQSIIIPTLPPSLTPSPSNTANTN